MNLDRPIGDIFVEEGLVTREVLNQLLASRQDTTERVGDLLVRHKYITEKQKLRCLGLQMGIPFADLSRTEITEEAGRLVPHPVALRLLAVPIEITEMAASVAMVNPLDLAAIDELSVLTGKEIDAYLATEEDVRDAIYRVFGAYDDLGEIVGEAVMGVDTDGLTVADKEDNEPVNVVELREIVEGAPVIKLANALMIRAIAMRASDIHIEPLSKKVRIRFRIDGFLQEIMALPKDIQYALASRIKIIASLDIAERRLPQDGRCTMVAGNEEFDFRVSTYPSVHGENIVIRILSKQSATLDLQKLGIEEHMLPTLLKKFEEPQGMVLVSGPTGSGKTTTLYATVNHLNSINRNIITIEDPVEYQIDGVVQGNVNPLAGVTFAKGLRSILRQDPDVILIGEIRDQETASIAIEASLTGHMVLSSLHANDSASALTRLVDIGIEPFLLASSVSVSLAQRLVRLNCTKCVDFYKPDPLVLERLGLPLEGAYRRSVGCEQCGKVGFKGRVGLYEALIMDAEIQRQILAGQHAPEIRESAERAGMRTLRNDALSKVMQGLTSAEEVLRVTSDEL